MRSILPLLLPAILSSSPICKCDCLDEPKAVHVSSCQLCSSFFCNSTCPTVAANSTIPATCLEKSSEKDRIIIITYLVLTSLVVGYAIVKDYLPLLINMVRYRQGEGFEELPSGEEVEQVVGSSRGTSRVIIDEEVDEVSWSEQDPIVWDEADHIE
jgi:hypothetical protein